MSHAIQINRTQLNEVSREPERILVGEVADISLPTLLHLLEIENVTGWLRLSDQAEISFHKGHVVNASFGPHRHLVALREIFFRDDWSFEVVRGQTEPGQPMHRLPFVMMDAFHLRAEWGRVEGDVYRLVGNQRWRPTGREVDLLMDLLNGQSVLRDLVTATGVPASMAIETILEALTLGLIEKVDHGDTLAIVEEPPPPEPASPTAQAVETAPDRSPPANAGVAPDVASFIDGADLDDLLDYARRAKRNGDLATAELAIRAALMADPESRIARQNLRRVIELRAQ